jgi:hypothetical protein
MIERIPELRTLSASDKLTLVTELWEVFARSISKEEIKESGLAI